MECVVAGVAASRSEAAQAPIMSRLMRRIGMRLFGADPAAVWVAMVSPSQAQSGDTDVQNLREPFPIVRVGALSPVSQGKAGARRRSASKAALEARGLSLPPSVAHRTTSRTPRFEISCLNVRRGTVVALPQ